MFRTKTAKTVAVWPLIAAVVSAIFGNFEQMAALIVVATPIFFVIGGLAGAFLNRGE